MYLYFKAFHIVFVVTWFSGLFYIVRLFIYNTEATNTSEPARSILINQFKTMIRLLWLVITWPSAILTIILGTIILFYGKWNTLLLHPEGNWLLIKLCFVLGLFAYHLTLHSIYRQQSKGIFKYTSMQLRVWNEVATVFLVAIVVLATVKQGLSFIWGLGGLSGLIVILMTAIKIYQAVRTKNK